MRLSITVFPFLCLFFFKDGQNLSKHLFVCFARNIACKSDPNFHSVMLKPSMVDSSGTGGGRNLVLLSSLT